MSLFILFQSILTGIAVAAPVGPIGMLCIRTTLAKGRRSGLAAGLGAAAADACYAAVAAFGITAIASFLIRYDGLIRVIGGVAICWLGYNVIHRKPSSPPPAHEAETGPRLTTFASTFLLTLTNPMTILSFASLAAGIGGPSLTGSFGSAAMFTAGVLLGSAIWWLFLSTAVSLFRIAMLTPAALRAVDIVSGLILLGFGVWSLYSALSILI
ncbi:LysE family transporter [Paenibacillus sp. M1]|uniref:LysE family transporter n=1 Tax=Paenibacillus haidiansis TaxID=1574488 RepID=A0ABU7VV47_9BACL